MKAADTNHSDQNEIQYKAVAASDVRILLGALGCWCVYYTSDGTVCVILSWWNTNQRLMPEPMDKGFMSSSVIVRRVLVFTLGGNVEHTSAVTVLQSGHVSSGLLLLQCPLHRTVSTVHNWVSLQLRSPSNEEGHRSVWFIVRTHTHTHKVNTFLQQLISSVTFSNGLYFSQTVKNLNT